MFSRKNIFSSAILISSLAAVTTPALALEQGDWLLRFGASQVAPNDDSGATGLGAATRVGVDSGNSLTFNIGYMLTDNVAVDLLAAWPFTHDLVGAGSLSALGKIGETKHLPPTLSLQYHFKPKAAFRPYIGAGINYTTFFEEEAIPAVGAIKLDDSWGVAAQLGADFDINKKWYANVDVRYINIETTATTSGAGVFDVDINPWIFTLGIGTTF